MKQWQMLIMLAVVAINTGCRLVHYTASPLMSGTIICSDSGLPICGARVLCGPEKPVFSDEDGSFVLPAVTNAIIITIAPSDPWRYQSLDIQKEGYESRSINILDERYWQLETIERIEDYWDGFVGTNLCIKLGKKREPQNQELKATDRTAH